MVTIGAGSSAFRFTTFAPKFSSLRVKTFHVRTRSLRVRILTISIGLRSHGVSVVPTVSFAHWPFSFHVGSSALGTFYVLAIPHAHGVEVLFVWDFATEFGAVCAGSWEPECIDISKKPCVTKGVDNRVESSAHRYSSDFAELCLV